MPWDLTIRHDHRIGHPASRVWDAVTTGRGNIGWLYPMEIEPRVGGTVARGVGGVVQEWSPPHRFACRIDDGTGFSSRLTYVIDEVDDVTSDMHLTIRWVHDQQDEPDAEWNVKADAARAHAVFYHHGLREYLDHFAGRDAVYVTARPENGTPRPSFPALLERLGVPPGAVTGDPVRFTAPGAAPCDAVLDHRSDDFAGLRTADGLYRFFNGDRWDWITWAGHHLFADDVDQQAATRAWQEWLADA